LGIFDIRPEELSHYFVEMRERLNQCQIQQLPPRINEPGCAIIKAVEDEVRLK
jgi:ribosome biogenesis GTPase